MSGGLLTRVVLVKHFEGEKREIGNSRVAIENIVRVVNDVET